MNSHGKSFHLNSIRESYYIIKYTGLKKQGKNYKIPYILVHKLISCIVNMYFKVTNSAILGITIV